MRLRLLTFCLLACVLSFVPTALAMPNGATTARVEDRIDRLYKWLTKYGSQGEYLPNSHRDQLEDHVEAVAKLAVGRGNKTERARIALISTVGWGIDKKNPAKVSITIRQIAQSALEKRMDPGRGGSKLSDWMQFEVLTAPDRYDPLVRIVSIRALAARANGYHPKHRREEIDSLLVAIMSAGRDNDTEVRRTAHDVLLVRSEPFISDYFLGALERGNITPELFSSHITQLKESALANYVAWSERRGPRFLNFVVSRLEAKDWRETSRALSLCHHFDLQRITPYLIQGLGVWTRRTSDGRRRIVHEYGIALGQVSGMNFGDRPEIWARWWQGATAGGKVPEVEKERSHASFFGLRPFSDRVLFVIDRSGSMRDFHVGRVSRFQSAVDRLLYTLRDLGPETQFGVVLFSSDGRSFSEKLENADEATLKRVEKWATDMGPGGGTNLQSGFRAAFPGLETGALPPTEIPYDTVIVLCDGETESPFWVAPWLAKYNAAARLVFHCVNIGGKPGGVLETLASSTGGTFIVSE